MEIGIEFEKTNIVAMLRAKRASKNRLLVPKGLRDTFKHLLLLGGGAISL